MTGKLRGGTLFSGIGAPVVRWIGDRLRRQEQTIADDAARAVA